MLTYQETIWREKNGYKTSKVQLRFHYIETSQTIKEQRARIEKLSLVAFLDKDQKKILMNVCRQLKRNNRNFYQNSNLHVTVLGFGPVAKTSYEPIQKKIQEFSKKKQAEKLTVTFNIIRPGTMYSNDPKINPISGLSNGIVVALGDMDSNKEFCNYSNRLSSFLLKDEKIKSVLGDNFRKKLPSVWCSMGYYDKRGRFRITQDLEILFKKYNHLDENSFRFSISEISLVRSRYKNIRYYTVLHKFKV